MKLIFVTQQVDPADPVLGATVAKLNALAARVDELVVLSLAAVSPTPPAHCPFSAALPPPRRGPPRVPVLLCFALGPRPPLLRVPPPLSRRVIGVDRRSF